MRVLAVLMCGLMLAGVSAQEKKAGEKKLDKKEEKKRLGKPDADLEGVWKVVSVEVEGKPWPAEKIKAMQVAFEGDQVTVTRAKKILGQGRYGADPAQEPAHLDYRESGDVYSVYDTGIYELEDDTLRWCTTADRKKRPAKFDSKEGMLLVLKKQSKVKSEK